MTRRQILALPFIAPLATAVGVKAPENVIEASGPGWVIIRNLTLPVSHIHAEAEKWIGYEPSWGRAVIRRNGVMYDVMDDGSMKMVSHNPNSMTYEYDATTGKRCLVSQSGEYLGEWF